MGINELELGQSDLVIAGGVDTMNDIFMYLCFSKTPALSPTGDCRPFSDGADGTMLGEGMAMAASLSTSRLIAVLSGSGSRVRPLRGVHRAEAVSGCMPPPAAARQPVRLDAFPRCR